jgi:hypothetical protein
LVVFFGSGPTFLSPQLSMMYASGDALPPEAISASSVLVLHDSSGSMNTGARQQTLAAHLASLEASGVTIAGKLRITGFGISPSHVSARPDVLIAPGALQALSSTSSRGFDAVYLFSDFDVQTATVDESSVEGYRSFARLLARAGARLYLASVSVPPPPAMLVLAVDSGGGLVRRCSGR